MNQVELVALEEVIKTLDQAIRVLDRIVVPMPDRRERDGATAWLSVARCKLELIHEGIYAEAGPTADQEESRHDEFRRD